MGKHEVGTPKYIANKIKAKGLQKLRWYCQMCQKQCRDENGFKCHTMSESHHRQLLLFADNSQKYLNQFSREFSDGYLELLSRQFGTKRVHANRVYQEYITDRNHLHMNATEWETLTDFVKWLGREGKCVVDETEKGWFVTYIDRDPEIIALQESIKKKEKLDKDDEERMMEFLERQIAKGQESSSEKPEHKPTDLVRQDDAPIKLDIHLAPKTTSSAIPPPALFKVPAKPEEKADGKKVRKEKDDKRDKKEDKAKRKSALDDIMEEEERKKKVKRTDYWLTRGIIVKVTTAKLGDQFRGKKGEVVDVIDKYCAKVRLLETGPTLKLDQAHVETVVPAVGKKVRIVNGGYRGTDAELLSIDIDRYCASLKICSGPLSGRVVDDVAYEDFSKLAS